MVLVLKMNNSLKTHNSVNLKTKLLMKRRGESGKHYTRPTQSGT